MLRTHDKVIPDVMGEDHKYRTLELPADKGFDLATEIMEIGSDVIGKLSKSFAEQPEEAGDDVADAIAIGEAMRALAIQLRKKGGSKFIRVFLKDVVRDKKSFSPNNVENDKHWSFNVYSANYGELIQVLAWILEVNFRSFFGGYLGNLLEKGQEMAETMQEGDSGNPAAESATI